MTHTTTHLAAAAFCAADDEPDYSQAELDRIQGEYPIPPRTPADTGEGRK